MSAPARTLRGFISYAHDDAEHFTALRKHLAPVERVLNLSFWTDLDLRGGQIWNAKIEAAIDAADAFIVLFSHHSIASDYIFSYELPAIARAVAERGALAIPMVLEPCFWQIMAGALQAVPTDPRARVLPILRWKPQHDGFHRAAQQTLQAIKAHFHRSGTTPFTFTRPGAAP